MTYILEGRSTVTAEICLKVGKVLHSSNLDKRIKSIEKDFTFEPIRILHIIDSAEWEREIHEDIFLKGYGQDINFNHLVISRSKGYFSREFFNMNALPLIREFVGIKEEEYLIQKNCFPLTPLDCCPDLQKEVISTSDKGQLPFMF